MDLLNLFWSFDASNTTKLIMFIAVAALILCIICKPRNKNKKIDNYNEKNLSKCQIDYKTCQENSKRGNIDNNLCHVCKPNGDYPDKIYNNNAGWIKVDPKTGNPVE